MGKDWHWGGRSTKKGGGAASAARGGGGGGTTTTTITTTSFGGGDKDISATTTTPSGCMSAVLQLFDFHQFQFPLHHPQPPLKPQYTFLPEDPTLLKGVEAPRNSLESEEEEKSSLSSVSKEEENLNFPVGIQIKTSADTKLKVGATSDLSSESSCSPAIKTPNLVARLMGLDLLPSDSTSSSHQLTQFPLGKSHFHHLQPQNSKRQRLHHRPSFHHHHRCFLDNNDVTGTRSLPETPRVSASRRSDVDHRLSLQINKENIGTREELDLSGILRRRKEMMKHENESSSSSSPSFYARQIVKQVKESVGRRVGLDITNTVKFREQRKDHEHPPPPNKSKKSPKAYSKNGDEFSPSSCSPRLRFLETKTKPVSPLSTKDQKPHSPKPLSPLSTSSSIDNNILQPKIPSKPKLQPVLQNQQPPMKKCKKPTKENFRTRLKKSPKTSDTIRNKQEEQFVRPSMAKNSIHPDKKSRKTPLSTDLLNISVTLKKELSSPPTTKIHQKQVHEIHQSSSICSSSLSSCGTPKYNDQEVAEAAARNMLAAREDKNEEKGMTTTAAAAATTTSTTEVQSAAEFQYISRILKRTGIDRDTTISSSTLFLSPSLLSLRPSIFHQLENEKSSHSMLIFHLVDEFLPEILKPVVKDHREMTGGELYQKICEKIKSIRCRKCEVLEDIDGMVDEDLPEWKLRRGYVEEEGEEVVAEIEREILEELVAETTVDVRTETARVEYCEYGRANRV